MLYRKIEKEINDWIKNDNSALLITGARQVGKSYIIRETLKKNNINFVEFNFIKQRKLIKMFDSALEYDTTKFFYELELAAGGKIKQGSYIFFDEIQEIKEIVTAIKFLVEQGKYKYILSGSLLGVELSNLRSAPVGYLKTIEMFPMDLEEFYYANGLSTEIIDQLKNNFNDLKPVSSLAHDLLVEAFYQYMIVGGMPEAVDVFTKTKDFNKVMAIHKKIIEEYKKDFTKYEKEKKLKLIKTYELIPSELDQKNKRYIYTDLDKSFKFDRYENSFNWLIDAGVAIPTYNVTEFEIPLEASKKSNLFKLFLSDVGMLTTQYGSNTILRLLDQGKDINCGAMFENFAAQELRAHGFKPYYFNNKKHGEVDFLVEYNNSLLPIEIKSGKDYMTHSALTYFMGTKVFNKAYVFSNGNISVDDSIIYYPIYMMMFLIANKPIEKLSNINLSQIVNIN